MREHCKSATIHRPALRRGFTLVELLVSLSIMLIITGLLLAALGAVRERKKVVLATTQVKDIYDAAQLYYVELRSYPPDTGNFGNGELSYEPRAIQRYLAMPVTDELGKVHGPFMQIRNEYLKGPLTTVAGLPNIQFFSDPWGNPYQFDAMHVIVDPKTGAVTRVGEPYPAATPDAEKTLGAKVWSYGADGKNNLGSLAPVPPVGVDADNITSWSN